MTDSLTSPQPAPSVSIEPVFPGLKLGFEIALFSEENDGSPMAWRWRGALLLEGERLARFARAVIERAPEAASKFPQTPDDVPVFFPQTHTQEPPREPSTLADAQAFCAALWALTPIYDLYEAEAAHAQEKEALAGEAVHIHVRGESAPSHTLQLPRSPKTSDEGGSGDYFRAAFTFYRAVPSSYLETRDSAMLACRASLGALERLGALEPGAWMEETEPMPAGWDPSEDRGVWEMPYLEGFCPLWKRLEISLASSRAAPVAKAASAPRV